MSSLAGTGLEEFFETIDQAASSSAKLSTEMRNLMRSTLDLGPGARNLAVQMRHLSDAGKDVASQFLRNHTIDKARLDDYRKHAEEVRKLTKDYAELKKAQDVLKYAKMSGTEKFSEAIKGAQGAASAFKNIGMQVAGLAGVTVGLRNLTAVLLEYNKTVFEGLRIGERYGDTADKFEKALKTIKSSTALSRQEFAELNLAFKQLYVGLPPTSDAVAKLASTMSGRLGWSGDQLNKKMGELLRIQNKLPSLFERINAAQDEFSKGATSGAKAALDLSNRLKAIGASRDDIEAVMSAISSPKMDIKGLLDFEKVMAKSKRDSQDASLTIAQKMRPAMELVANITGTLARQIEQIPKGTLLAVAAMGAFGTAASVALKSVILLKKNFAEMLAFARANSMTPGSAGGWGAMGRGMVKPGAKMLGSAALLYGAEQAGDWLTDKTVTKGGDPSQGWWKGAMSKGASYAASGAITGKMYGGNRGAAIGAVLGGAYGAISGGISGQERASGFEAQRKNFLESRAFDVQRMGAIATGQGVAGVASPKEEELDTSQKTVEVRAKIIQAIKAETDESKSTAAIERLIAENLVDQKEVVDMLIKGGRSKADAEKKALDLITKAVAGEASRFDQVMQVQAAMRGVTAELETQLDIANKLADMGSAAGAAMEKGLIDSGLGDVIMKLGLSGTEQAAKKSAEGVVAAYVSTYAGNADVLSKLFPKDSISEQAMAELEKVGVDIQKKSSEIQGLGRSISSARTSDEFKDEGARESAIKKLQDQLKVANAELEVLQENLGKGIKVSGLAEKFDMGNVTSQMEQAQKQLAEMQKALNSGKGFEIGGELIDGDKLKEEIAKVQGEMSNLGDAMKKSIAAGMEEAIRGYEVVRQKSQREIGVQEQLIQLGKSRLALAEKMGMPQSYEALKNQVGLTYDMLKMEKQRFDQYNSKAKSMGVSENEISAIISRRVSAEQLSKDIAASGRKDQQGRAVTEKEVYAALSYIVPTMTKITDLQGELAEQTKSWREGWLDAMSEQVINAGDFAAVIGMQDKNVPELIAAGAPDTFRYGGTNRRALNDYEANQARYGGNAFRYTSTYGVTQGNITAPNPLQQFGNTGAPFTMEGVMDLVKQMVESGNIQVNQPTSVAGQADLAAQIIALINQGKGAANVQTGTGGSWQGTIEGTAAGMKDLGTQQPGGSPTPYNLPTAVLPQFENATNNFDAASKGQMEAAEALKSAAASLNGSAKPGGTTRASGGFVRMAGGGFAGKRFASFADGGLTKEIIEAATRNKLDPKALTNLAEKLGAKPNEVLRNILNASRVKGGGSPLEVMESLILGQQQQAESAARNAAETAANNRSIRNDPFKKLARQKQEWETFHGKDKAQQMYEKELERLKATTSKAKVPSAGMLPAEPPPPVTQPGTPPQGKALPSASRTAIPEVNPVAARTAPPLRGKPGPTPAGFSKGRASPIPKSFKGPGIKTPGVMGQVGTAGTVAFLGQMGAGFAATAAEKSGLEETSTALTRMSGNDPNLVKVSEALHITGLNKIPLLGGIVTGTLDSMGGFMWNAPVGAALDMFGPKSEMTADQKADIEKGKAAKIVNDARRQKAAAAAEAEKQAKANAFPTDNASMMKMNRHLDPKLFADNIGWSKKAAEIEKQIEEAKKKGDTKPPEGISKMAWEAWGTPNQNYWVKYMGLSALDAEKRKEREDYEKSMRESPGMAEERRRVAEDQKKAAAKAAEMSANDRAAKQAASDQHDKDVDAAREAAGRVPKGVEKHLAESRRRLDARSGGRGRGGNQRITRIGELPSRVTPLGSKAGITRIGETPRGVRRIGETGRNSYKGMQNVARSAEEPVDKKYGYPRPKPFNPGWQENRFEGKTDINPEMLKEDPYFKYMTDDERAFGSEVVNDYRDRYLKQRSTYSGLQLISELPAMLTDSEAKYKAFQSIHAMKRFQQISAEAMARTQKEKLAFSEKTFGEYNGNVVGSSDIRQGIKSIVDPETGKRVAGTTTGFVPIGELNKGDYYIKMGGEFSKTGTGVFEKGVEGQRKASGVYVGGVRQDYGKDVQKRASGGAIESGSYIVNAQATASNNLGSMGFPIVTGGTAGKDSVMFDIRGGGGGVSSSAALLMPGEAIVPPSLAGIGEAINSGVMRMEKGGIAMAPSDAAASRDIAQSLPRSDGGGGSSGSSTVNFALNDDIRSLFKVYETLDRRVGSTPHT